MAARGYSQWPFGLDVYRIGLELFDYSADARSRRDREPNLRICRTRQRPKAVRRNKTDVMMQQLQLPDRVPDGRDDTIDLRRPGIGNDQNAHRYFLFDL